MLTPKPNVYLKSNQPTSILPLTQGPILDGSKSGPLKVGLKLYPEQASKTNRKNREKSRGMMVQTEVGNELRDLGPGLSQPMPTSMEMTDSSAAAAQSALFEFDYMPSTYNFTRKTYNLPHDMYDFDSELSSVNWESELMDSTNLDGDENEDDCQMNQTQEINDFLLDCQPGSSFLLSFKNTEGNIEELGPNWPFSDSGGMNSPNDGEPEPESSMEEVETSDFIKEVIEDRPNLNQPPIEPHSKMPQSDQPKKTLLKKAQKAALNLATQEGAPLPALNADEVCRKKPIESAVKQSNQF